MKKLFSLLFILFFSDSGWADFTVHPWEDFYETKGFTRIKLNTRFYSSSSNFDASGDKVGSSSESADFSQYLSYQGDFIFQYGFFEKGSFFVRGTWGLVRIMSPQLASSVFGLMDQTLGITYRLVEQPHGVLDLQFQGDFPAYSQSFANTHKTPYLGTGSIDWTSGFFMNIPFLKRKKMDLSALFGGSYTYRTLGFSSAIPWSGIIQYAPPLSGTGFFIGLGGQGVYSLKTDLNNGVSAPFRITPGTGGSFVTYGVNPSLFQLRGQLGYRLDGRSEFSLLMTQSFWGQNASNGFFLSLGFQLRIGHDKMQEAFSLSPESYGESNQGFLTYALEALVLKVNDRMNLVKINKGAQDGVKIGDIFDVFRVDIEKSQEYAIARAKVSSLRPKEAALEILEYYQNLGIEEKDLVKRLVE